MNSFLKKYRLSLYGLVAFVIVSIFIGYLLGINKEDSYAGNLNIYFRSSTGLSNVQVLQLSESQINEYLKSTLFTDVIKKELSKSASSAQINAKSNPLGKYLLIEIKTTSRNSIGAEKTSKFIGNQIKKMYINSFSNDLKLLHENLRMIQNRLISLKYKTSTDKNDSFKEFVAYNLEKEERDIELKIKSISEIRFSEINVIKNIKSIKKYLLASALFSLTISAFITFFLYSIHTGKLKS